MVKNRDWEFVKPSDDQVIDFLDIKCFNFHEVTVDELSKDQLM